MKEERARLKIALAESNRRQSMLNFQRGHAAFEKGQIGSGMLWMAETFRSRPRRGPDLATCRIDQPGGLANSPSPTQGGLFPS